MIASSRKRKVFERLFAFIRGESNADARRSDRPARNAPDFFCARCMGDLPRFAYAEISQTN
jgi:hypothetical protein